MDNLRTPLSRVRLWGSAREGTNTFIAQRLTAIALVPLLLWFVAVVIFLIVKADYVTFVSWIRSSWNTELLILLILVSFHHAHAGLHEVVEDYVHNEIIKAITMVSMKFLVIGIAVASVLAVLQIALGG
ncbi:MAG: succinate dehydrogenase, hydrophobic membrane anchor protein [Candidatus Parabeggiatoa sp. nov. 1]|nr:MAG: succinate dehydrogenase, hydrophobic membrane anchor protein [Gammaproteobacteria bacterium]